MTSAATDASPTHRGLARRASVVLLGLLVLAVALLHLRNLFVASWDHDEVEHLHAAWLVGQGLLPFRDFFEAHQPPLWYALAPVVTRVPAAEVVLWARLTLLPFMVGTILASWRLACLMGTSRSAAALAALLLPATWVYLRTSLEVRPDVIQVFLEVLALERLASWSHRPRWMAALACGLFAGLSVAFLHKGVAVIPGLVAGCAMAISARRTDTRRVLRHGVLAAAGFAAPLGALYAAIAIAGLIEDYWFCSVQFMLAIQARTDIALHFGAGQVIGPVFADSPAIFLAGASGCLVALSRWRDPVRASLLVTLLATALLIAISRMPFKQFFLPVWPLLSVFAADAFAWLDKRAARSPLRVAGTIVVAASLALTVLEQLANPTNHFQRVVAGRVREVTQPGDAVFVPPPWHPVDRADSGYLWFDVGPFLAAIAQMEAQGEDLGERGARMREVLARPPRAALLDASVGQAVTPQDLAGLGLVPDSVIPGLWVRPDLVPPPREGERPPTGGAP